MTHFLSLRRRAFLTGAASTGLVACTPGGLPTQDKRAPIEGGIGGTGIVGLLTDDQRLALNGLSLRTDAQTQWRDAYGPVRPEDLRQGMPVTVQARSLRGELVATRVRRDVPLVGVLVSRDGGLAVNGVTLRLEPDAAVAASPGMRVMVSGLWQGARVVTRRIDPAAGDGRDVIAGDVHRIAGGMAIGPLALVSTGAAPRPEALSFATALGRYSADGFAATELTPGRFAASVNRLRALSIEGYLEPLDTAPGFRVSGLGHSFDRNAKLDDIGTRRALFEGGYRTRFEVERGVILPEAADARVALLAARSRWERSGNMISTRS